MNSMVVKENSVNDPHQITMVCHGLSSLKNLVMEHLDQYTCIAQKQLMN